MASEKTRRTILLRDYYAIWYLTGLCIFRDNYVCSHEWFALSECGCQPTRTRVHFLPQIMCRYNVLTPAGISYARKKPNDYPSFHGIFRNFSYLLLPFIVNLTIWTLCSKEQSLEYYTSKGKGFKHVGSETNINRNPPKVLWILVHSWEWLYHLRYSLLAFQYRTRLVSKK